MKPAGTPSSGAVRPAVDDCIKTSPLSEGQAGRGDRVLKRRSFVRTHRRARSGQGLLTLATPPRTRYRPGERASGPNYTRGLAGAPRRIFYVFMQVLAMPAADDTDSIEFYVERAAIMEFDGGLRFHEAASTVYGLNFTISSPAHSLNAMNWV